MRTKSIDMGRAMIPCGSTRSRVETMEDLSAVHGEI
jgi:hypothetical protein